MDRTSKKGTADGKPSHMRPSLGSSGPWGPVGRGNRPACEAGQPARAGKEGVPRHTNGALWGWEHPWVSQREPQPCSAPRGTAGPCFRPYSAEHRTRPRLKGLQLCFGAGEMIFSPSVLQMELQATVKERGLPPPPN